MAFPSFHGGSGENGEDFLDEFQLLWLLKGECDTSIWLKSFPLALRGEARVWYNGINNIIKEDWVALKEAFLYKFYPRESTEEVLSKLQCLQQEDLCSYRSYEESFLALLARLDMAWEEDGKMSDFLIKKYFVGGLFNTLQVKVDFESPKTFHEAIQLTRKKFRKMMYKLHKVVVEIERLPSHRQYEKIGISFGFSPRSISSGLQIKDPHPPVQPLPTQNPNKVLPPPQVDEEECIKKIILEKMEAISAQEELLSKEKKEFAKIEEPITKAMEFIEFVSNQEQVLHEAPVEEEEVEEKVMVNSTFPCLIEKEIGFGSKGEGLSPQVCDGLAHIDVVPHGLIDGRVSACTFREFFGEESSIEATSEKQAMALIPSDRHGIIQFFGFDDDLEMGDASSPLCQVCEGLEMGDSSRMELVESSSAESRGVMSMEAKYLFKEGLFSECHAVDFLWFFLIEESVLRFEVMFHLGTMNFGASYPLCLQFHDEKQPVMNDVTVKNPSQLVLITRNTSCNGVPSLEEMENNDGNTSYSLEGSLDVNITVAFVFESRNTMARRVFHIIFFMFSLLRTFFIEMGSVLGGYSEATHLVWPRRVKNVHNFSSVTTDKEWKQVFEWLIAWKLRFNRQKWIHHSMGGDQPSDARSSSAS